MDDEKIEEAVISWDKEGGVAEGRNRIFGRELMESSKGWCNEFWAPTAIAQPVTIAIAFTLFIHRERERERERYPSLLSWQADAAAWWSFWVTNNRKEKIVGAAFEDGGREWIGFPHLRSLTKSGLFLVPWKEKDHHPSMSPFLGLMLVGRHHVAITVPHSHLYSTTHWERLTTGKKTDALVINRVEILWFCF